MRLNEKKKYKLKDITKFLKAAQIPRSKIEKRKDGEKFTISTYPLHY
jgi:hypothetical protein